MDENATVHFDETQLAVGQQLFMACGKLIEERTKRSKLDVLALMGYFLGSSLAALGVVIDEQAPAAVACRPLMDGYRNERAARTADAERSR